MEDMNFLEIKTNTNHTNLFQNMLGKNGNTIPYKNLINISYCIAEDEFNHIYIMDIEANKYFIDCLTTKKASVYLWGDGLILDFNLNSYFKLDNFQINEVQKYIENNKKITFIVYDEKNDRIKYEEEKIVNIL